MTYCVIFAGTYTAYAGTCADIAFVYDSLLLFNHGWILSLSGSEVESGHSVKCEGPLGVSASLMRCLLV